MSDVKSEIAPGVGHNTPATVNAPPLKIYIVAGEPSGDRLGGELISALKQHTEHKLQIAGVGGPAMAAEGLTSLFPLSDVAVMGPLAILRHFPRIARRVYQTIDHAVEQNPDVVVIIDSPEFTHPIANRIRKKNPQIPIIDYVCPSVWAWRSGRAKTMTAYVDHVLALLPFEPEAVHRLGGPQCSFVGHPLAEKCEWIDTLDVDHFARQLQIDRQKPVVVVLPGSRRTEIGRLMKPFDETLELVEQKKGPLNVIIPVVKAQRPLIENELKNWKRPVHLVDGEEEKFNAFRLADAALAASGTVTLELALSQCPMVVAYKVDPVASLARYLINVPSVVLANLVLGRTAFPEHLQEHCTPENLAASLIPLLENSPQLSAQKEALAEVRNKMDLTATTPSEKAASIVLSYATKELA